MKMALTTGLGVGLMLALASPSFAASVSPTSYPFTLKGGGNLNQGSNYWACGFTLQGSTTSSSGGSISGGTGDTNANCTQLTVGSTTWSVTSSTAGEFHGLTISGGGLYCNTPYDVPFTITKSGNRASSFFFKDVSIGSCYFAANLNLGAALTVLP